MTDDHDAEITVGINEDEQRMVVKLDCPTCGSNDVSFPLAHVPAIRAILGQIMADFGIAEAEPDLVRKWDATEEEAARELKKGRH